MRWRSTVLDREPPDFIERCPQRALPTGPTAFASSVSASAASTPVASRRCFDVSSYPPSVDSACCWGSENSSRQRPFSQAHPHRSLHLDQSNTSDPRQNLAQITGTIKGTDF